MKIKTRTINRDATHGVQVWKLGYLETAVSQGRKFLSEEQYTHAVQLFEELAFELEPTKSETQNIEKIEEFYELKDKGGILGKINLRVYFAIFEEKKLIFVLGAYKKEDEGQTPKHIKIQMRNRLRIVKGEID